MARLGERMDLTGQRYGRLVVVGLAPSFMRSDGQPKRRWECACDCGARTIVTQDNLRSGQVKSCGCQRRDSSRILKATHGDTRNATRTAEYAAWRNMLSRCENPRVDRYPIYGGRGITVCDRWRESYENFLADMGRKPSPRHSIDRIDVNGRYEPDNCRWATPSEQAANQRRYQQQHP